MEKQIILDPAAKPDEIERKSFAIIDIEIPEPRPYAGTLWEVARRCIHALGDTAIINDLKFDEESLNSGLRALRSGCRIYTDTRMLAAGLVKRRMDPLGITPVALMDLPDTGEISKKEGITRSRAGIRMIAPNLEGSIVAIGNAPTALLALLEELEINPGKPALIIGMPVGFVNAAQSKALLAQSRWPHFTLFGRKGGSAIAAACVNAMAEIVLKERAISSAAP